MIAPHPGSPAFWNILHRHMIVQTRRIQDVTVVLVDIWETLNISSYHIHNELASGAKPSKESGVKASTASSTS